MPVEVLTQGVTVCAACRNAKPQVPHVDFGAADLGFATIDGREYPVDDMTICRDCVDEAADKLGRDRDLVARLEAEREQARREARDWKVYAEGLEEQYGYRPEPKPKKPGRKPADYRPVRKPGPAAEVLPAGATLHS